MKSFSIFLLLLTTLVSFAQTETQLTSNGFEPVEIPRNGKPVEKLIAGSKEWADFYNKLEHDVFNVTENGLEIDAMRDNAFFYRNVGENFSFRVRYNLKVTFEENVCRLEFSVKEIYAKKTLLKTTLADYFNPDGTLKEDFEEVKPSIEKTANKILRSYADFISQY